jgi:hypothetical protein
VVAFNAAGLAKNPTPQNLAKRLAAFQALENGKRDASKLIQDVRQAQTDFDTASTTAQEKAGQAKYAESAARSAEGVATHVTTAANNAKEAAEQGPVKKRGDSRPDEDGEKLQDIAPPADNPEVEGQPGNDDQPGKPEQAQLLAPGDGEPNQQPPNCPDVADAQPACEAPPEPDTGVTTREGEEAAGSAGQEPVTGGDQELPSPGTAPEGEDAEQPNPDGQTEEDG